MLRLKGDPLVSIIVCSRNRAASLDRTLRALGQASIPPGWKAEVLVVDNGSTDETAEGGAKRGASEGDDAVYL